MLGKRTLREANISRQAEWDPGGHANDLAGQTIAAKAELLGAIVYTAAAYLLLEETEANTEEDRDL